MKTYIGNYFIIISILVVSFNAYGIDIKTANSILRNQFPTYTLALDKDFNSNIILGEWGNDKGINFAPQAGDFNNDSIPDLIFFAYDKDSIKAITISGKKYIKKNTILFSCHGSTNSIYQCFKVFEKEMIHPLWYFYTITDKIDAECQYAGNQLKNASIITVHPALGNISTNYWFNGNNYQSCSYGD